MTAHGLAFRQDFAAPLPTAAAAPAVTSVERLRAQLLQHQRDDGHWTDEWAADPAALGPVGVTARAVVALVESGVPPATAEVVRAVDWLWGRTVAPAAKDPDPPEAESLAALVAFLKTGRISPRGNATVGKALRLLREVQNEDGGWALDRAGIVSDPESTGDVVAALGLCGITAADAPVRAALAYLEREQEPDSGWGSLTATAAVLAGFRSVGVDERRLPVRRAAEWIKRTQLAGGGWGEAGQPMLDDTAHAVRALRAAGDGSGPEADAGRAWLAANPPDEAALGALIAALAAAGGV